MSEKAKVCELCVRSSPATVLCAECSRGVIVIDVLN